jgi:hypothetical protein
LKKEAREKRSGKAGCWASEIANCRLRNADWKGKPKIRNLQFESQNGQADAFSAQSRQRRHFRATSLLFGQEKESQK